MHKTAPNNIFQHKVSHFAAGLEGTDIQDEVPALSGLPGRVDAKLIFQATQLHNEAGTGYYGRAEDAISFAWGWKVFWKQVILEMSLKRQIEAYPDRKGGQKESVQKVAYLGPVDSLA